MDRCGGKVNESEAAVRILLEPQKPSLLKKIHNEFLRSTEAEIVAQLGD
jgi:hypothetical protein